MKKIELFFSTLFVPVDFLMLVLAGISAYYLRFADFLVKMRPVIFHLPFDSYIQSLIAMSLIWLLIFFLSGLYQIKSARKLGQEIKLIFAACSMGLGLVAIIIFFRRDLFDSRFIVVITWLLAILYVSFAHIFIRWLQRYLYRFGIGVHKIILVGNSKTTDNLLTEFSKNKKNGFEVVKRVRDFSLDTVHELIEFIAGREISEIIQGDPNLSKAEVLRLYDFSNENHITFRYVADLLEVKVLRTEVSEIIGIPIIEVKKTTLDGWGRVVKRISDIIGSGLLIIILSPVFITTVIIIAIDSKGPIMFSRRDDGSKLYRIGENGKPFTYFKFRSMIPNSDEMRYHELAKRNLRNDGPMVKIKNDPRITRVGHFIRRWSIDELPELFLVFIGRMSLVGPRPHLPEEVAKYENYQRKALTIKPGITGLAQISGRSDLLFEEEVKLDVYYMENWSLLFDITILLKTPLAVLRHCQAE